MKVRYHFETIDGTAYSTLDVRPGEDRFKYPGGCNWFYDKSEGERQCAEWNARQAS